MGLIEIFDVTSSLMGLDVSERGTIGWDEVIMAMRGGEPGNVSDGAPMIGDKFVD